MVEYKYRVIDDNNQVEARIFDSFEEAYEYAISSGALLPFISEYTYKDGIEWDIYNDCPVEEGDDASEIVWNWDDTWDKETAINQVKGRHYLEDNIKKPVEEGCCKEELDDSILEKDDIDEAVVDKVGNNKFDPKILEAALKEAIDLEDEEETFTPEEQEEYGIDEFGHSLDGYDDYVRCSWCNDPVAKYNAAHELNMGYLCPSCVTAIRSRGEKLTIVDEALKEAAEDEDDDIEDILEYDDVEIAALDLFRLGWCAVDPEDLDFQDEVLDKFDEIAATYDGKNVELIYDPILAQKRYDIRMQDRPNAHPDKKYGAKHPMTDPRAVGKSSDDVHAAGRAGEYLLFIVKGTINREQAIKEFNNCFDGYDQRANRKAPEYDGRYEDPAWLAKHPEEDSRNWDLSDVVSTDYSKQVKKSGYEESLEETVPEDLVDNRQPVEEKEPEVVSEPVDYKKEVAKEKGIDESLSQEIVADYKCASKYYRIPELQQYVNDWYAINYPDRILPEFAGDVIYSEKYWDEFEQWLKANKNIDLAAIRASKYVDEGLTTLPATSEQELQGTDNAVVDCPVNKVIAHSKDEKPLDCKMKKKPLDKPLTEDFADIVAAMSDNELIDKFKAGITAYNKLCARFNEYGWSSEDGDTGARWDNEVAPYLRELKKRGFDTEALKKEVSESLKEAFDMDTLNKDLAAHNAYIEYLQKELKEIEEREAKEKNNFIKLALQRRIETLNNELNNAIPAEVSGQVEVTAEPEQEPVDQAEADSEEPKEDVKESFNNDEQKRLLTAAEKLGIKTQGDLIDFSKAHGNVKDQELLAALEKAAAEKE